VLKKWKEKRENFQKAKVRCEMQKAFTAKGAEVQSQPRRGEIIVEPNHKVFGTPKGYHYCRTKHKIL